MTGAPYDLVFTGALLTVGAIELLIVVVPPTVVNDPAEARLTVVAYHARFGRPVVLMAQDLRGAPRYFGPDRLTPLVAATPFELIPWRQLRYGQSAWPLGPSGQPAAPPPPAQRPPRARYLLPTGPVPPRPAPPPVTAGRAPSALPSRDQARVDALRGDVGSRHDDFGNRDDDARRRYAGSERSDDETWHRDDDDVSRRLGRVTLAMPAGAGSETPGDGRETPRRGRERPYGGRERQSGERERPIDGRGGDAGAVEESAAAPLETIEVLEVEHAQGKRSGQIARRWQVLRGVGARGIEER